MSQWGGGPISIARNASQTLKHYTDHNMPYDVQAQYTRVSTDRFAYRDCLNKVLIPYLWCL